MFFYANGSSNTEEDVQFCNPGGESFFENFTVEIGINASYNQLMDLGKELDICEIDDKYELYNTQDSNNVMLNYCLH